MSCCCTYMIGIAIVSYITLYFMRPIFRGRLNTIRKDLKGQIVFITGANTGIGKETAIELSKMGATIILACRDIVKGQQALTQIGKDAHLVQLDLSDLNSVKDAVSYFSRLNIPKIDILINNAGIMAPQSYQITKQGFEIQFGTNHLGHFLLTQLLTPYLQKAKNPRVINVSSKGHQFSDLNFDDLQGIRHKDSKTFFLRTYQLYGVSKLANILHAMEISSNIQGVKACSLHPGVIQTELMRHQLSHPLAKITFALFQPINRIFMKTPIEGAQCTLYCALMDDAEFVDGGYYKNLQLAKPYHASQELSKKLWDVSVKLVQ